MIFKTFMTLEEKKTSLSNNHECILHD